MLVRRFAFVCVLVAAAAPLWADQVIFKNGDKLTGTIVSMDGGKLVINTAVAGNVTVDMEDVQTFSTDAPIMLKLKDGTVLHEKLTTGAPGTVAIAPGGTIQPQPVALEKLKQVNPPPIKWSGSLTAGAIVTKGNTDSDSFNVGLSLVRRSEIDRINIDGGYFYAKQKDIHTNVTTTTADNWFLSTQYSYFVSPKWYVYGDNRIEKNRIANLNLRLTPGVGAGYQWLDRPDLKFNTEAGLAWVYENFSNDGTNQQMAARLAYHFVDKLSDNLVFLHDTEVFPKFDNSADIFLTTDASLRATLTKTIFSEIKLQFEHDGRPAPGAKKDDTQLMFNVGWQL